MLRYQSREVHVLELTGEPDPNLLDLCADHVDRLTPPMGWAVRDGRSVRSRAGA